MRKRKSVFRRFGPRELAETGKPTTKGTGRGPPIRTRLFDMLHDRKPNRLPAEGLRDSGFGKSTLVLNSLRCLPQELRLAVLLLEAGRNNARTVTLILGHK